MNVTEKTGSLVAIKGVVDTDDLMIINKSGIAIRLAVEGLRVMGRATQGVRLIRITEGDAISSVAKVEKMVDDDSVVENQEADETTDSNKSEENNDKKIPGDGDDNQSSPESDDSSSPDENNE